MDDNLTPDVSADQADSPQPSQDVEIIDVTESLSSDQVQDLFDAFDASDWVEVDKLIDSFEAQGVYPSVKAGGADRNSGNAETLRRYWTTGPGGAKIGWGASGDWTRCVSELSKYLGPRAKGYCALRHKEMNGFYPGDNANKSDSTNMGDAFSTYHETKQVGELGEPMLEHKTVGVKGMKVVSAESGIVETIISVTGMVDNVKDRIMPGAYAKTLAKRKPKGVWSHDWDTPVSKTLSVKELLPGDPELPGRMPNGDPWPQGAGALKVKTQFNLDTQRGREAYSDVTFFGDEQEWSIGYNVPVGGAQVDTKSGVREIGTLELYEYSPVLFGAMPLARTTSVKEAQLALKALKGGAASWLNEVDDGVVAGVAEYAAPSTNDEEGSETLEMSGDDMMLVKTAIQTLSDLLEAVETETKGKFPFQKDSDDEEDEEEESSDEEPIDGEEEVVDDEEDTGDEEEMPVDDEQVIEQEEDVVEGDVESVGTPDPKARLEAALAEAANNPPEEGMWGSDNPPPEDSDEFYSSMAEAVDDLIDDPVLRNELIAIADEIDTAMDEEDTAYFEEAVRLALDKIEENLGADDEADLKELAEIIADSIDQMGIEVPQEEVDQATGDNVLAEEPAMDIEPTELGPDVDPAEETAPDENPVLDEEDPALVAEELPEDKPVDDATKPPADDTGEVVEEGDAEKPTEDDEEDDEKKKGKFPFAKNGKTLINVSEYKSLLEDLQP